MRKAKLLVEGRRISFGVPLTFGSAEADGVHAVPSMLLTKLQPFTNSPVKISEVEQLEVGT